MSLSFAIFQEPSLFAVAKLLETGLNNLHRARVLWKPLTAHLLEVGNTKMPVYTVKDTSSVFLELFYVERASKIVRDVNFWLHLDATRLVVLKQTVQVGRSRGRCVYQVFSTPSTCTGIPAMCLLAFVTN